MASLFICQNTLTIWMDICWSDASLLCYDISSSTQRISSPYVREQGIPKEVVEMVQAEIAIEREGHLLRDCSENGITKALLPFTIEGDVPSHRQDVDDACDGINWTNEILFDLHTRAMIQYDI